MSDELILNVSFDNQTVTDATENWTLSGTPNVTYEQISGGSGYSLVTGTSGTPPTLVAVDQEAIYNEYTIDFNLYVKPSYTDAGWFSFFNLNTGVHYTGDYKARVYNGLTINLEVGSSTNAMVTIDSPTGRWIHITIISEYDSDTGAYTAYLYVDSVLRTYKQGTRLNGSPFAIGEKLVLFNRGGSSFYLPNTPGLAIDNLTVIAGIHVPNQTPAISLPNLSRVFQNFCTWLKGQLSTVALTGSYNDLSDKPTIGTVNDGTLTIQKNGTNVATFTANQSAAATANITVPTAVSELTNDSGYLTASSNLDASKLTSGTVDIARLPQGALERLVKVANEAARYALTAADVQLGDTVQQLDTGIMYVVTDTDHLDSAAGYTEYTAGTAASVPWSGVTGKPTFAAVATSGAYSDLTGTPALATVATSGAYSDLTGTPTIPTVNNATLTIQKNGTNVQTFTANQSTNATANITVPTKTSDLTNDSGFITSDNTKIPLAGSNQISGDLIPATTNAYDLGGSSYQWNNAYIKSLTINGVACGDILTHNVSEFIPVTGTSALAGSIVPSTDNSIDIGSSTKNIKMLYTKGITIDGTQFLPSSYLPKTTALESLSTNSIPFHNSYPRCKYLGTTITSDQNEAIKNRTYDDLFIGDYWTIDGVNWRIVAIDYYYNVGDTNFDKGNVIVMPDTVLYNAQMNETNTTAGAYHGSLMRTQNLNSARTIAQNAFGSHLANHRIVLANTVDSSGPSNWSWCDSDGVELPNEVQIYGTRIWGSALKGYDVATQKQQFPLLALAPQFVNTRQSYWLQDVSSNSVSSTFADVSYVGYAANYLASTSSGVRPSVTLSYI